MHAHAGLTKLCARPTTHRHKCTRTNIGNQWVDVRPQTGAAAVFVTECKNHSSHWGEGPLRERQYNPAAF